MKLFGLRAIQESFRLLPNIYSFIDFSIYPCKGSGSWNCTDEDCPPCLGVDTDGSASADCTSSWLWAGEVDARDELDQTSQHGKVFRPIFRIARWMWEIRAGGIRLWRSSWGMTPGGLSVLSWRTPTRQERHRAILLNGWPAFGFPPLLILVSPGFAERIMPAQKKRSWPRSHRGAMWSCNEKLLQIKGDTEDFQWINSGHPWQTRNSQFVTASGFFKNWYNCYQNWK